MSETVAIQGPKSPLPPHVNPEWVVDLDVYALPRGKEDPHLAWLDLLDNCRAPMLWSPYNGGHWIPTDPRTIGKIQRDARNFSSEQGNVPDRGVKLIPLEADPPMHAKYRRIIDPLFAPSAIRQMEPMLRNLAIGLIEKFEMAGQCEFISDFALGFPVGVVMQLLGLPMEDGVWLNQTAENVIRHPDVAMKMASFREMENYLSGWLDRRIEQPTGDGLSLIAHGMIDDRPLTRDEKLRTGMLLILGGVDALAMVMGFIMHHLATHPDDLACARENLDDLDAIIHELCRRFSGANRFRKTVNDLDIDGVTIKAGDMVSVSPIFYNLRDEIFPDAACVRFDRPEKQAHLSFGTGIHTCVGAVLARLEIKILLQEWIKRIPAFELAPDASPRLRASVVPAVDELRLVWPVT